MKAQDFLLGLRDFFAILVPGAVFLLLVDPTKVLPSTDGNPGGSGIRIFAFAIAAYLIGSVMAAMGSWLDLIVDPVLESRRLPAALRRTRNQRKRLALKLRNRAIKNCSVTRDYGHPESLRGFWWDQLRLTCPPAAADLERIEATQKLFRSLIPVLLLTPVGRLLLGQAAYPVGLAGGRHHRRPSPVRFSSLQLSSGSLPPRGRILCFHWRAAGNPDLIYLVQRY